MHRAPTQDVWAGLLCEAWIAQHKRSRFSLLNASTSFACAQHINKLIFYIPVGTIVIIMPNEKIGVNSVNTEKTNELPDLETSLTELTTLIEKMEQGDLTLEQSLSSFERGVSLITHAQKILREAEQKVQILIQNNGEEKLEDYENN